MTEPKQSISGQLDVSAYDESFGANLDRAAEATPVVGNVYSTGKSIAEHAQQFGEADGLAELAAASKGLASDGAAFVAGAAADVTTFAMDPIGWLVSNGLNMLLELVQPLQDALHQVSGDGPAIGHASGNFTTIAQGFLALADDFEATGDKALKDWRDEAGDAAREALGEFSTGIRGVGSSAGSVAEVLQMWSMVMVVIEEVIKAIISELVSWLITLWLPALASSVITLGGSVAAAMTASIAKAATVLAKVTRYLGKFGKLLDEFMQFLVKYAGKLEKFAERFRVGKVVDSGGRQVFQPSRRVLTTALGTHAGVTPFLTGAGIKAGIGAGKALYEEADQTAREAISGDAPVRKGDIGGGQSPEETRRNLDI
ncbi:hypothetical protein [Actinokineospora bangkokensis]|uniref:Uncharacterized protein n=1 Tax=Actinokineospora bangkokensis TaxID=1193682 RepID=A0A1Q9LQS9_9PSEU|nr:hypothetical protein [Actinokineospora bangkokensis]OLR94354.1 hypothetical protein BJP25_11345 [Actinokineospora bangkokensis]